MSYRLFVLIISVGVLFAANCVYAADSTRNRTNVAAGVSASGYVGEEAVTITRIKTGRFLYPKSALRRGLEGDVTIEYNVGIDGSVTSAFIVEANPPGRFDSAALRYVNSFEFEPYRHNGTPAEVERVLVKIPFKVR